MVGFLTFESQPDHGLSRPTFYIRGSSQGIYFRFLLIHASMILPAAVISVVRIVTSSDIPTVLSQKRPPKNEFEIVVVVGGL